MKTYSFFVLLFFTNCMDSSLKADYAVQYRFNPITGAITDLGNKKVSLSCERFLLPNEIISNQRKLSLINVGAEKWFGVSSYVIKSLAEKQGKIGFLMGFKDTTSDETLRIVFHFERWPGLSHLPSEFLQEIKGVMFFPFVPKNPMISYVPFCFGKKVPYVYAKKWEMLPKYFSVAFPCYVLWKNQRLVFAMSPQGPFFTINLEGREAVFQRKFTKTSEDGRLSCTAGPVGISKAFKLKAFNVNVYEK